MTDTQRFIERAIDGFLSDPPDSDFQRGYLAALLNVYREGLGVPASNGRIIAAEKLTSARTYENHDRVDHQNRHS
jgi:hypothetical protein